MQTKRAMILVSNDPESIRLGAKELIQHLSEALVAYDLQNEVEISTLPNVGTSNILPLVVVYPEATVYGPVKAEDARFLVEEHLYKGRIATDLIAPPKQLSGNVGWLRAHKGYNPAEQRIVLERAGRIDPENIEEFIAENGYQALGKALSEMTPEQVIETIDDTAPGHTAVALADAKHLPFPTAYFDRVRWCHRTADNSSGAY